MTPEEKTAIVALFGQITSGVDAGSITSVNDVRRAILVGLTKVNGN